VLPPSEMPAADAWILGWAVRAAFVVAGALLSVVDYGFTGWLAFGLVLCIAAPHRFPPSPSLEPS